MERNREGIGERNSRVATSQTRKPSNRGKRTKYSTQPTSYQAGNEGKGEDNLANTRY